MSQGGLPDLSVTVITAGQVEEGMIGGMGDDDEYRLDAQIIVGTGGSSHSLGSHDQQFQGGLLDLWCSGVYKMRSR